MKWQARLARVPRWAWVAFFIGAVVPVVVLLVLTLAAALLTGVIVMMAVLLVGAVLGLLLRIFNMRGRNDGRRNMQIIVTGHQVIDP